MLFKKQLFVFSVLLLIISCKKENLPEKETPKVTTGLYILNEGGFGQNNTSITYYSFENRQPVTDYYFNVNNNSLGDLGNDILIYGSKLYIVMNGSSYVQVADAATATAIKRIEFEQSTGGVKRQPRYAVPYKGAILVSSFDGTVAVIDTVSLTINKFINVGANPDGLAVSGDKLYVANSGGLTPGFDSTVSVIDLTIMEEVQKIVVGTNPGSVTADDQGNVYIACIGNYQNVQASLVKVNTATNEVVKAADTAVGKIVYHEGLLYATGGFFGSANVRALQTSDFSEVSSNFVTDGTAIGAAYGIKIDETNGDVYITDAKDFMSSGEVFCFDKNGKKKFSFSVAPGSNPNSVAIIK